MLQFDKSVTHEPWALVGFLWFWLETLALAQPMGSTKAEGLNVWNDLVPSRWHSNQGKQLKGAA